MTGPSDDRATQRPDPSFGVVVLQDRPIGELLAWAERFDEAGVDSLWVVDHLAKSLDATSFWYDGWTVLAAIAERTTRCRIGPLVSNFVLQSPLRMARLTTTIDALSNGRLDLGLGMGGAPVCRSASNVFDDGPGLADRFETGLASLIKILNNEPLPLAEVPALGGRYEGRLGPESVVFATPCVQIPRPPIIVGGHGPRLMDVAARIADRWNVFTAPGLNSPEDLESSLRRIVERFEERCAVHGRAEYVPRSILLDNAPGLQAADRHELADLVTRLHALGFDEFQAVSWPAGWPDEPDRATDELLAFVAEDFPALAIRHRTDRA